MSILGLVFTARVIALRYGRHLLRSTKSVNTFKPTA
jgi:hypothetical protein